MFCIKILNFSSIFCKLLQLLKIPWLFPECKKRSHFPGFPVGVGTMLSMCKHVARKTVHRPVITTADPRYPTTNESLFGIYAKSWATTGSTIYIQQLNDLIARDTCTPQKSIVWCQTGCDFKEDQDNGLV